MAHRNWDINCKVYIGGLRDDANRYDLEDAFAKYGPVRDVWVARRPPGFAFVEMEDTRDAEDASRGLDGTRICGSRVKVEMSNGGKKRDRSGSRDSRDRGRDKRRDRSRSRSKDRRRRSPSYRSMSRDRDESRERGDKGRGRDRKEPSRSRSRS
eukprot:GFUD01067475.1.p1 GENE.GFUD01067475.1~~GFUD01067475.1.p1  ORF type:complete len:154 (+),score=52.27 GFUD01067475.1:175-636(+)